MRGALPVFCLIALGFLGASASLRAAVFPSQWSAEGIAPMQKLAEYRYVYRFFFKLYDAALYLDETASADAVLTAETAFHLEFRYLREIDKSIILKSADRMLEKNLSAEERAQIADRVERLNEKYQTVREGDRSSLTYQPEEGTTLRINGAPQITLPGQDFAELYFRIWLGPQPISAEMKSVLLGKEF